MLSSYSVRLKVGTRISFLASRCTVCELGFLSTGTGFRRFSSTSFWSAMPEMKIGFRFLQGPLSRVAGVLVNPETNPKP